MQYATPCFRLVKKGAPPISANFAPPPVETGADSGEGATSLEIRHDDTEGRLDKGNASGPESLEDQP